MTEKMKKLIEQHGEVLDEIFEDVIEPILLEQQKISFMKDNACEKQLQGFTIAFRTLEQVALEGKEKKEKRQKEHKQK